MGELDLRVRVYSPLKLSVDPIHPGRNQVRSAQPDPSQLARSESARADLMINFEEDHHKFVLGLMRKFAYNGTQGPQSKFYSVEIKNAAS